MLLLLLQLGCGDAGMYVLDKSLAARMAIREFCSRGDDQLVSIGGFICVAVARAVSSVQSEPAPQRTQPHLPTTTSRPE